MNRVWTPVSLERSIVDRIRADADRRTEHIEDLVVRAARRDARMQRLRRELAYRRLLARIYITQPSDWVIKGGTALQFRLDPNRHSNDVDLAHLDHGVDQAVAIRRLRAAASYDAGDLFEFDVGDTRDLLANRAATILVIARLGAKEFARFDVDIPVPKPDVPSEVISDYQGTIGIDILDEMPPLRLIALEQQVADKVCAMFELHGDSATPSGRSRDLGDLAMLAAQCRFDGDALTQSVRAEEARRRDALLAHGLPARIELDPRQAEAWRDTWLRSARDPQFDFDTSLAITARFLDPLLAGDVRGMHWDFANDWRTT